MTPQLTWDPPSVEVPKSRPWSSSTTVDPQHKVQEDITMEDIFGVDDSDATVDMDNKRGGEKSKYPVQDEELAPRYDNFVSTIVIDGQCQLLIYEELKGSHIYKMYQVPNMP